MNEPSEVLQEGSGIVTASRRLVVIHYDRHFVVISCSVDPHV